MSTIWHQYYLRGSSSINSDKSLILLCCWSKNFLRKNSDNCNGVCCIISLRQQAGGHKATPCSSSKEWKVYFWKGGQGSLWHDVNMPRTSGWASYLRQKWNPGWILILAPNPPQRRGCLVSGCPAPLPAVTPLTYLVLLSCVSYCSAQHWCEDRNRAQVSQRPPPTNHSYILHTCMYVQGTL